MPTINATGQDPAEQLLQKLYNEGDGNVDSQTTPTGASAVVSVSDPSVASTSLITLHGATPVVTIPAVRVGYKKTVYLIQDATGSRIPTYACTGGAVKWVGAAAPTLQTAAGSIDKVSFESYDGINVVGTAALHIA
jgi:hypothetical protein